MMNKIKITEVVEALEMQSNEIKYFYDKKEKKISFIMEGYDDDEMNLRLIEKIESNYTDYIALPTQYEINEHQIMVDFANEQKEEIGENLLYILHSKKAFRKFKDEVFELDIRDDWFRFRDEKFKDIAKRWCLDNGLDCLDYGR